METRFSRPITVLIVTMMAACGPPRATGQAEQGTGPDNTAASPSPSPVSVPMTQQAPSPDGQDAGLPPEELEKILGPIALYPDVLLAQILPAATFPMDIVQAARWLRANPDMATLLDQKWDPSVLALCNYPDVIYMLDKDLDWTNALGAAFLSQQQDVMNTIQDLRRMAESSGALKSTPEQTVVADEGAVRIVPTQENVVYVPQYDPQVVYVTQPAQTVVVQEQGVSAGAAIAASAISFGTGLAMGAWLNHDCSWGGHGVVWCQPGYWGGWGHVGKVNWDDNRWAAVGSRGGAYVGPHGAAVWGDNGRGAAWTRSSAYGRPSYTGRYSSYNRGGTRNTQINRGSVVAGNQVNFNRNTANIDRGDRTNIQGGNRTNIQGGNRANVQGGSRTNVQGANRTNAFGDTARASQSLQNSQRGSGSRSQAAGNARTAQARKPAAGGGAASARTSSFKDTSNRQQAKSQSSRGAASRGGGASHAKSGARGGGGMRGGGGKRGGGGGGGRRR